MTYSRKAAADSGYSVYAAEVEPPSETAVQSGPSGTDYWWPTYSPDGSRIASGGGTAARAAVYVGGADGAGWHPLDIPQPVTTEDVTWSPDGTAILVFANDFQSVLLVPVITAARRSVRTGGSVGSPSWQRLP